MYLRVDRTSGERIYLYCPFCLEDEDLVPASARPEICRDCEDTGPESDE